MFAEYIWRQTAWCSQTDFTVYIFPKLTSNYPEICGHRYGDYRSSAYPVSLEFFEVSTPRPVVRRDHQCPGSGTEERGADGARIAQARGTDLDPGDARDRFRPPRTNRVVVLADGRIVEDGPPGQVIDNPRAPRNTGGFFEADDDMKKKAGSRKASPRRQAAMCVQNAN